MPKWGFYGAAFFLLFAVVAPAFGGETAQEKLNGGYYLLHRLAEDEDQVPLIFLVKHDPGVKPFADQISQTAKRTLADLEQMHDRDPALRYDCNPLPAIEQDTRDSIRGDKQHQLLYGSSGPEFARAFLVSQIEACTYAINLSRVLAGQETDPGRIKTLHNISGQWLQRRNDASRLLRDY